MVKKHESFQLNKYVKPGKDIVIELDDEVEYILDREAIAEFEAGKEMIRLVRVIDQKPSVVSARRIQWAVAKEGIVDYLDANE